MSGQLVILSGPSGVGKDTVIERWRDVNPRVKRVVSATTRGPREGEVDGIDYHFIPPKEFEEMAARDEFLEHKDVHGRRYGTPRQGVKELMDAGHIAILKIDVQGAEEILRKGVKCCTIFLMPPSEEELERRIRGRGTDRDADIELRLKNAKMEIERGKIYQHRVVNDDLDACVARIDEIVRGGCG